MGMDRGRASKAFMVAIKHFKCVAVHDATKPARHAPIPQFRPCIGARKSSSLNRSTVVRASLILMMTAALSLRPGKSVLYQVSKKRTFPY